MKIILNLIIMAVNIVLFYKICRLSYTRDKIKKLFNLDKKEISTKDVDEQIKRDKVCRDTLRKKEMESRVHNQVIEDIDNNHKQSRGTHGHR